MSKDFELPETHIERMDRLAFERDTQERQLKIQADRDVKVAKERRKEERAEMWIWLGGFAAVAAVLITLAYAWWIDVDPKSPEDFKTTEAGREQACVENGGGWVPEDILSASNNGLCVYPGRRVEVPAE